MHMECRWSDGKLHPGRCRRRDRHVLARRLRSEPQDRRGSAVRGDAEATVRSGGAGVLPMTLGGRPDIEMGRRWCVNVLCPFSVLILLIYRERASQLTLFVVILGPPRSFLRDATGAGDS